MSRPVLLSVTILSVAAAGFGYIAGRNWEPLSETDAIAWAAERYQAETGKEPSECSARPGTGDVWIVVRCGDHLYPLDRYGALIEPMAPET